MRYLAIAEVFELQRMAIEQAGGAHGLRDLAVFFVYKPASKTAIIISARDMEAKERRTYGRK